ncbi:MULTISPECIES: S8 family serine peptidase [Actinomadura]|uniref:S8 family serine peptidase n=1 Tax=Actinomadura yumaensis TaxID=111807 RepID=A0ABW2CDR0_9ACTN|nr:S8 family serine peptidase [Actinomadura sp. J1-007]MWK38193.1 S8 family serine peptidase [Actinomadura sp. J1-007]
MPLRAGLLALALVLTAGTASSASSAFSASGGEAADTAKITPSLASELRRDGRATFFVRLKGRADLTSVRKLRRHSERAAAGYRALTAAAERDQRGLRRMLTAEGADFESFWIVNTVLVRNADAALAARIAARPEVTGLQRRQQVRRAPAAPASAAAKAAGPEWNIERIRAPKVWQDLGVRGENIVVAGIDTGARFDHPALLGHYRGRAPDGTVSHAYNWLDAMDNCPKLGKPAGVPCDLDSGGHGSHTIGTAVGDDGAGNQIGVAPGAKWISAAAGGVFLLQEGLLRSGQWVMAPTDLNGADPRPDLAANVVTNSWGWANWENDFFADMIDNWVGVGIFPVFGAGNSGPACGTTVPPGHGPAAYTVGATGGTDAIWNNSSRGPSALDGGTKPNIAAPGADIRSVSPGGGYAVLSGTSMATPHVAGTVALMWSANPALVGDVQRTRQILDATAVDASDLGCGGTAENNNVYGQGRLDAFAAVQASLPAR